MCFKADNVSLWMNMAPMMAIQMYDMYMMSFMFSKSSAVGPCMVPWLLPPPPPPPPCAGAAPPLGGAAAETEPRSSALALREMRRNMVRDLCVVLLSLTG